MVQANVQFETCSVIRRSKTSKIRTKSLGFRTSSEIRTVRQPNHYRTSEIRTVWISDVYCTTAFKTQPQCGSKIWTSPNFDWSKVITFFMLCPDHYICMQILDLKMSRLGNHSKSGTVNLDLGSWLNFGCFKIFLHFQGCYVQFLLEIKLEFL